MDRPRDEAAAPWAGLLDGLLDGIVEVGVLADGSAEGGGRGAAGEGCDAPALVVASRRFFASALALLRPAAVAPRAGQRDGHDSDESAGEDRHVGEDLPIVPAQALARHGQACDALFPVGIGYLFIEEIAQLLRVAREHPGQHKEIFGEILGEVSRLWVCSMTHASPLSVAAEQLGVSEHVVVRQKHFCAAAVLAFERQSVRRICEAVVAQVTERGGVLHTFWWTAGCDETPLRFRMSDSASERVMEEGAKLAHLPSALGFTFQWKDSVPHKILQSQTSIAMLVIIGNRSFHLWLPLTTWLQALDSTGHGCYWRALQQFCGPIATTWRTNFAGR